MTPMECNDARPQIPSYIDGELSSTQSGALRKHLLDCQPCRASAQDVKNLKRWFVEPAAVTVPDGFAARVARRAFAGDTGFSGQTGELQPALRSVRDSEPRELRFVLMLTAAAAVLMIVLSVAFQNLALPHGGKLMADDQAEANVEQALRDLDRINHPASASKTSASNPAASPAPVRGQAKQP